jgi:hypothetical protein
VEAALKAVAGVSRVLRQGEDEYLVRPTAALNCAPSWPGWWWRGAGNSWN